MSSIYKDEILRIEDPVTHKPALSTSRLSEILGKDRQNFAEKWREGRLTKAMQGTTEDNLPRIHEETRLHSYGWSLFFRLRVLRDTEDRARDRIKSASETRSLEKIDRAYEYGIREVVASFIPTITKALSLVDEENADTALSQDDLTDVYLAGAVLHTALIVWEDAADALAALGERDTLDFELLNLDGFVSVVDVAEKSHALYCAAEFELRRLARKNRKLDAPTLKDAAQMADGIIPDGITLELRAKEARDAQLALQDAEIAAVQIASIASHALDWQRASPAYQAVIGAPKQMSERLERLAKSASKALRSGVALLDRLPNHQLLARNIAYQAIQCDDAQTMRRASEIIAVQKGVEIADVWREKIMGRRPLNEEIHLASRFEDGMPKLLMLHGEKQ